MTHYETIDRWLYNSYCNSETLQSVTWTDDVVYSNVFALSNRERWVELLPITSMANIGDPIHYLCIGSDSNCVTASESNYINFNEDLQVFELSTYYGGVSKYVRS